MTASLWSSIGPGHGAFPFCITLMSLAFPIFTGAELAKRIPSSLVSISARSNRFFNVLGVKVFDRVLTVIRWNALVLGLREPVTKPSDLPSLSFDLRSAAMGHGCGLLVHAVIAAFALSAGYLEASLWILLPSIPLHASSHSPSPKGKTPPPLKTKGSGVCALSARGRGFSRPDRCPVSPDGGRQLPPWCRRFRARPSCRTAAPSSAGVGSP
jgi:hypothetical protein